MKKHNKILVLCLPSIGVGIITITLLFVLNVISILAFLLVLFPLIALASFVIYYVNKKRKSLEKKEEKKFEPTGDYKTDLYGAIGIPVQYNEDGSVKDIYELLGLVPIFNDKGERVLTIYELLEIMPKFTNDGKEIPVVVSIKNRVGGIAKVDLTQRVLIRKLTEKEQEELLIKQTLKQKLKEAEAKEDKAKQKLITDALNKIAKSDKKKEEKSSSKPLKYKSGKSGKAVATIFKLGYKQVADRETLGEILKKSDSAKTVKPDENAKESDTKATTNTETKKEEITTFELEN